MNWKFWKKRKHCETPQVPSKAVICFNCDKEFGFDTIEAPELIYRAYPNLGTISDTFLIRGDTIDIRYYEKLELDFYYIKFEGDLFFKNTAYKPLSIKIGDKIYVLDAGECIKITERGSGFRH